MDAECASTDSESSKHASGGAAMTVSSRNEGTEKG